MKTIDTISNVIAYIEEHLNEDIDLETIAKANSAQLKVLLKLCIQIILTISVILLILAITQDSALVQNCRILNDTLCHSLSSQKQPTLSLFHVKGGLLSPPLSYAFVFK